MACNLPEIANGRLLDFIRRVNCFGIELLKLDVRQESGRHRQAISAITEYLGLGNFDTDRTGTPELLVAGITK